MRRGAVQLSTPLAFALFACVLVVPTLSEAQCGRPDLESTLPRDGAVGVPSNAQLTAAYASTAEYDDENVELEVEGAETYSLLGDFDASEGILSITPPEPLREVQYTATWPRLRGLGTASRGGGATVTFMGSDLVDTENPQFDGLTDVRWDIKRANDDCTDDVEERVILELELGAANDDSGRENLNLIVFQTRGPNIDPELPEQILLTPFPSSNTLKLARTVNDSKGTVCFAAIARDLTGRISASGDAEVCTKTVAPPFFEGCSLTEGAKPASGGVPLSAWLFGLSAMVWAWRRRGT